MPFSYKILLINLHLLIWFGFGGLDLKTKRSVENVTPSKHTSHKGIHPTSSFVKASNLSRRLLSPTLAAAKIERIKTCTSREFLTRLSSVCQRMFPNTEPCVLYDLYYQCCYIGCTKELLCGCD